MSSVAGNPAEVAAPAGDTPDEQSGGSETLWGRIRAIPVWQQIFAIGIAIAICAWAVSKAAVEPHRNTFPYTFPNDAYWISARGPQRMAGAVFRTDFTLPPSKIARAWVAVSADNGFEVICNGNPCGRWTLYRATRDFQNGHTEYGQRIRYRQGALRLNYPREYQWSDNKNWQLPMFLDITRYLKTGDKNALAVTAQARHPNSAFILTGEIILENGRVIPIRSHPGWKGSYAPFNANDREWTETGFQLTIGRSRVRSKVAMTACGVSRLMAFSKNRLRASGESRPAQARPSFVPNGILKTRISMLGGFAFSVLAPISCASMVNRYVPSWGWDTTTR